MSKSFLHDYSHELSRIFEESKGRTNKILGSTKLGIVSKPMSHYTGSPRINDLSRNSGVSDLPIHHPVNSSEVHHSQLN